LEKGMPHVYEEFVKYAHLLEEHYKDMQDIEFTIEDEKLYILQTRDGKRTTQSAIKIVTDLVKENIINKEEAIMRINPNHLNQLLHPAFDEEMLKATKSLTKGLAASPGAASGKVYFNAEDVMEAKQRGEKVILARLETSPEDIEGMVSAEGILTSRGGMTSHAAVVARGMGKCCVAGASQIRINEEEKTLRVKDIVVKEGENISLDGSTGMVYVGKVNKVQPELSESFEEFMNWVDEIKRLEVRANADNPQDAAQALKFGAQGIGLCRTEHMFFGEERITSVRKMIMASDLEERVDALDELLP